MRTNRLWDTELLAFWDHECCRVGLEVPQEECYEPIPSQLREEESKRTRVFRTRGCIVCRWTMRMCRSY